jgi:hypothetical protein
MVVYIYMYVCVCVCVCMCVYLRLHIWLGNILVSNYPHGADTSASRMLKLPVTLFVGANP